MCSAMVVHHQRNQDEKAANESKKVRSRTTKLIKSIKIPSLSGNIQELYQGITTCEGNYKGFLKRWGYDTEQLKAIKEVIEPLLRAC
jgi:hypothetical protein